MLNTESVPSKISYKSLRTWNLRMQNRSSACIRVNSKFSKICKKFLRELIQCSTLSQFLERRSQFAEKRNF